MLYGCRFINFGNIHWFNTQAEAEEYGRKSGFQWALEVFVRKM